MCDNSQQWTPPVDSPDLGVLADEPASHPWRDTWSWIVAALVTVALAYLTYTGNGWIQILSAADLGIHEFGHLVVSWAPMLVVWPMGSVMQVSVPLAFAAYFYFRRHDRFATIIMLAWAAENLNNVSVYIWDATRLVLPLFGDTDGSGAGHDWANELTKLHLIVHTDAIALTVKTLSAGLFAFALGMAVWGFLQPRLEARRSAQNAAALRVREASLPVHEPFNPVPSDSANLPETAGSGVHDS